jgi:serine/threonine protein kinase
MSLDLPIDEDLLHRLPLPLAQLYRRAHNAKTPLEQYLAAFYLWEAAIKLLGAVAVAEYAARGTPEPRYASALEMMVRPSLWHWWQCARLLVPALAEREPARFQPARRFLFGPARDELPRSAYLAELLREAVEGRRAARAVLRPGELFDRVIAYRNQEIGHGAGAQRSPEFHQRMAGALLAGFAEVTARLDLLAGNRLVYVGAAAFELRGTGMLRTPGDGTAALRPERLYLMSASDPGEGRPFVPLYPLLHFDPSAERVYFFVARRGRDRANYLCYATGDVAERPLDEAEWRALLGGESPGPAGGATAQAAADESAQGNKAPALPARVGDCEVLSLLGQGGEGVVYLAWQPSLGRQVAVKVIHRSHGPGAESHFRRQVEALTRVDHPHLGKIYSAGSEGGQLYFVMELLEGETLAARLRRAEQTWQPMFAAGHGEQVRVVTLVRQVASALQALHDAGIIYGDVKPSNVMVSPDGLRAVLFDMGLSRFADDRPVVSAPSFVGTLPYASPEQMHGPRTFDPRSDVYSLGVMLWELLTRRRLVAAAGFAEMVRLIVEQDAESVRTYNAGVPAGLDGIVLKALRKAPAGRYASARELADDLDRWLCGEPVRAHPSSPVMMLGRALGRLTRKWRATVGMTALFLLLLMAAVVGSFAALAQRERELREELARRGEPAEVVRKYQEQVRGLEQELDEYRSGRAQPGGPPAWLSHAAPYAFGGLALSVIVAALWLRRSRPGPAEAAAAPPRPAAPAAVPAEAVRRKPRGGDEAFSSQTVILRYPAPIAIAYRRFCARPRHQQRDRLAQLFDTFEITLKYLVYLGLADLCHCRLKAGPPYEPLPKHQGFDLTRRPTRMTLGQWARSLRDCADVLARQPGRFVRELPEVCGPDTFLDVEIIRWVGANRNAATHRRGGIALTSEKCEPLLREARPRLERLFQEIAFVRRYPLGFVTAGHPLPGDRRRYRVHSCMGARVAFGEEVYPMEAKVCLPEGVPFVVAPDESAVLCLWPFLMQRESDFTQRPALYVFEEIDPDRHFLTKVSAAAIDHEDDWPSELHPADAEDHGWLWAALAELPQAVAVTPELRLAAGLAESLVGRLSGESLGEGKHYKLLGPIARGGFGTVYDAVDQRDNTRVAVKVLEDHEVLEARDDRNQFRRFQQEYDKLKAAGKEHAGIVRCFEWGADIIGRREYPWYSMEFAVGGDLNDRLHERRTALQGRMPWDDAALRPAVVEEFRAIADAVAHLHESNIIHRDVKPANVLVMEGGGLRLSDFGLIKELERPRAGASVGPGSSRGAVLGTRDYMAPEQERGDAATRAADVYALGVVLAELLTGGRPQPARNVAAGSPLEPDERLDRLPEPLRRLVLHCTDLDPALRPADARYLLHLFEQALKRSA